MRNKVSENVTETERETETERAIGRERKGDKEREGAEKKLVSKMEEKGRKRVRSEDMIRME